MTSTETTEAPETEETPEATETAPQQPEESPEAAGEGEDTGGRTRGLRQRAQEAEAEVERLGALLSAYRTAEITEAARAAGMHDPGDLLAHREIGDLLADDGTVDSTALGAALDELREQKRHLFRGRPAADHSQGSSAAGGSAKRGDSGDAWSRVLKSGKR